MNNALRGDFIKGLLAFATDTCLIRDLTVYTYVSLKQSVNYNGLLTGPYTE